MNKLITLTTAVGVALAAAPPAAAVPMVGMNGVCGNAWALANYISANYAVHSIGGIRPDRLPDHPSGHAIDIMVDTGTGNAIAADLRSNPGRFGIKYLLWQVPAHYDHVHVTVF